ncbi:reverse transcriptase [Caerostris extrusa]|uniref:Reverse transcriptase n=1 Tax=Caerostris extrusa TaxID=172846 RepID=A0AAV4SL87_CAEEX|nr:reverse transcriptase [Caerostris extrusa]
MCRPFFPSGQRPIPGGYISKFRCIDFLYRMGFRFGHPLRITTDQGTQFEVLTKFLGTARHPQAPTTPAGNGQVERLHRQLKAESDLTVQASGVQFFLLSSWDSGLHGKGTYKQQQRRNVVRCCCNSNTTAWGILSPSSSTIDPVNFVGKLRETTQELLPLNP